MPRGPQSSPTQDLEARFAVFLNPIRDLTKNWEVDIAKYLEEYLEELAEVQITFDGGETMMNFAEAAMLIQGSATVYSKKVEFLWQMVLQMLDLLSSRRGNDAQEGTVEAKEGGGGGKANMDVTREFSSVDGISEGRNIDMKDDEDEDEVEDGRKKSFKFLPSAPLHLVEKEGEKSQHRINLLMKNNEVFGAKDDFRINRSYQTSSGMLCLDVPLELLQGNAHLLANDMEEDETSIDGDIGDCPQSPMVAAPDESGGMEEAPQQDTEQPDDQAPQEVNPLSEITQPMELENEEKADKTKESENNNIDVIDLPNGRYGLRKRGEKEAVVKLKLSDPWKPLDPHADTPSRRPVRAGRLRKPLSCNCHVRISRKSRARRNEKEDAEKGDNKKEKQIKSIESFVTQELTTMCGTKARKLPPELGEEGDKEHGKRLELQKQRKVKALMKTDSAEDKEEAVQKVMEETQMQQRLDEQLEDSPAEDGAADLDCGSDGLPDPMFFPEPHDGTRLLEGFDKKLNDSQSYEPGSDYEALVQKLVSDYISSAQDHVNTSELTRRVNRWRQNILPKLEEEEKRAQFDIHGYGSQVLSFFPENGRKQTIPFENIARNQGPPEVCRLFLSCLMLANTYNVELEDSVPGDFSMDCLELTLLSRVRHHEELEEYAAPSQGPGSPTKRKGRVKGNVLSEENEVDSGESPSICADITHITIADNIQVDNYNNVKKSKSKKKR